MPTKSIPNPFGAIGPAATNKIAGSMGFGVGVFRLPTDPLFFADLTLQNVVANSRYRVTRADTGAELALDIGGGSDIVIGSVPCYTNPMLVNIMIRNASGATKYKPFATAAYIYKTGGSAYVIQTVD